MLGTVFIELLRSGGISGFLIASALLYLALQVRALQHSVDKVQMAISEKVFPRLDDHTDRIATLEGRYQTWETMRETNKGG